MIEHEPNVIWLVYEERKSTERAVPVHSCTAPNLPSEQQRRDRDRLRRITESQICGEKKKIIKKLSPTEKFSLF